jgi:hypothetical protein
MAADIRKGHDVGLGGRRQHGAGEEGGSGDSDSAPEIAKHELNSLRGTPAQTNLMARGMNDEVTKEEVRSPEWIHAVQQPDHATIASPGSTIGTGPARVRCLCRYCGCALRLGWCGWVWSRLMAPTSTPYLNYDLAGGTSKRGTVEGSHIREVG